MKTLWKPPFRLDISDVVKSGKNELEVKVTNLWVNRLIGDEHFPAWEGRVNGVIDNAIPLYENAVLVDWRSASNDFPEYFARDGVHLTKLGSQIYLDQIIQALGGEVIGEEEDAADEESN